MAHGSNASIRPPDMVRCVRMLKRNASIQNAKSPGGWRRADRGLALGQEVTADVPQITDTMERSANEVRPQTPSRPVVT